MITWDNKLCKRILPFQTVMIEIQWGKLEVAEKPLKRFTGEPLG